MQRVSALRALLFGAAMAAMSLAGAASAPAALSHAISAGPSFDSGSGATANRTTTNGSTQIRTEPQNRWPAEPLRIYGPYVSHEQLRLIAR